MLPHGLSGSFSRVRFVYLGRFTWGDPGAARTNSVRAHLILAGVLAEDSPTSLGQSLGWSS